MSIDNMAVAYFHNLVKKVKKSGKFPEVKFLKAFRSPSAPNPMVGFAALCDASRVRWEKCYFYEDKKGVSIGKYSLLGKVQLIGEKHSKGVDLQTLGDRLSEAFIKADTEGFIVSFSLGDVSFQRELGCISMELNFNFEFFATQGEEGSDGTA